MEASIKATDSEKDAMIALLIEEADGLRDGTNTVNWSYGRRTFSPEQMEHGRLLSPSVGMTAGGYGLAKVES